jgi:hypothetical protein
MRGREREREGERERERGIIIITWHGGWWGPTNKLAQ